MMALQYKDCCWKGLPSALNIDIIRPQNETSIITARYVVICTYSYSTLIQRHTHVGNREIEVVSRLKYHCVWTFTVALIS